MGTLAHSFILCADVLVYGILGSRVIGVPAKRYTSVLVYMGTSARCTDVPVYLCAGEPVYQATLLPVYYHNDVPVHQCPL